MSFNLELLTRLVAQNSFSYNKRGVDVVGEMIAKELNFMTLERYPYDDFGDLLVFHSKDQDEKASRYLLGGHSDTVHPPERDFPIKIEGGKMRGPGTQDMKSGLVVIVETLKKLHKVGKLKNISFALTPDEELQNIRAMKDLMKIYKDFDFGLVYEPTLQLPGASGFCPGQRSVVTTRKGQGRYKISIQGPGGHSGVLTKREERFSAIEEAAHKIIALEKLANYEKGTNWNIGLIQGGSFFNVLAEECVLEGDFRAEKVREFENALRNVEKIGNSSIFEKCVSKYELISTNPPIETNGRLEKYYKKVWNIGKEMRVEVLEEARGGASDANKMAAAGILVLDGFGAQGLGEHTRNEFVYLQSIEESIRFSYRVLGHLALNML